MESGGPVSRTLKKSARVADRVLGAGARCVVWGVTMRLAWTADDAADPVEAGHAPATPALERLAQAWADAPVAAGRMDEMRDLYRRRHADMVRFAAFLTGDVLVAEDIAQDAFARVFDAWDRIDDPTRVDAYLKSTVVNLVRDGHRRQQAAGTRPTTRLTVVPSAEDDAIDELRRRRTLDAVAALPLRQRACVVMRHWMRMTESEIADALELSVGSVRTHIKRGIDHLRISLGEQS